MLTVSLSPVPHVGGIVVGVTDGVVGIGSKSTEGQILGECHLYFHVNVKMSVVLILLHLQQCQGITDPECFRYLVVFALGILRVREGRVEGGGRIEELLLEGKIADLLQRSYHAEFNCQMVVKGQLHDVELGDVVLVPLTLYHRVVFHHTH